MRNEHAETKRGWKAGLAGAAAGLTLVAGTLLATGGAPATHATSFAAKSEAAASATPDRVSPREAIAERDTLDLQLD
jgi:hypothetical protein